jgi:hypothetical protein
LGKEKGDLWAMALNNAYQYDVFISYKSEDYLWAQKLYDDLSKKGLQPFLDRQRLQAGEQWEPQLAANLRNSQHLVVLWSKKAAGSNWVNRETYTFDAIINIVSVGSALVNRRMLFILLEEGENPPFSSLQMINELRKANAYAAGINQVDLNLWTEVVRKIDEAIRSDDASRPGPVPLAIMAMTRPQFDQLDPDEPFPIAFPGGKKSLNTLLKELDIASMQTIDDLKHYYGDKARDWKPFGSDTLNIRTIMETLKDEINQRLPGTPIRWDPVGDDFWTDDLDIAQKAAERLLVGWAVIVIDPLSLYNNDMYRIFGDFIAPALDNPKAVFMTLPPFDILRPYAHFRVITKLTARRVYEHFYNPSLPQFQSRAKCNVNIGDQRDIMQWLLTTLGLGVSAERSKTNKHPVLQT